MPATTLVEIKNFVDAVERALAAVHESVGGRPIVPRGTDENADDIWIVPIFQCGPASGHLYKRPDGCWDYDLFENCLVGFDLSVPRVTPQISQALLNATYGLFAQEIARIRLALDPARFTALNAELPFHHLTRLKPGGASMGYDADRGEDRAEIRFSATFGIKPEAWPTDPAAYTALP